MLLKLAAIGVLGYAAYRYIEKAKPDDRMELAGGPLSDQARLQSDPNMPPLMNTSPPT